MTDEHIDYLSVEDLLEIAAGIIDEVAVRDAGLLAAAAGRPQVTVFGDDAYPTLEDKAAALLHSLVRSHALVDGNERLAWTATRVFCSPQRTRPRLHRRRSRGTHARGRRRRPGRARHRDMATSSPRGRVIAACRRRRRALKVPRSSRKDARPVMRCGRDEPVGAG